MARGIASELRELGIDEGIESALSVAEKWQLTLEDMAEAANPEQLAAIVLLLNPIRTAIGLFLEQRAKPLPEVDRRCEYCGEVVGNPAAHQNCGEEFCTACQQHKPCSCDDMATDRGVK